LGLHHITPHHTREFGFLSVGDTREPRRTLKWVSVKCMSMYDRACICMDDPSFNEESLTKAKTSREVCQFAEADITQY
jgi:hypothetical protein